MRAHRTWGRKPLRCCVCFPKTPVDVIERCSGHGGTFGVVKKTHDVAVKVGQPVFRAVVNRPRGHIASDCPLAGLHIVENASARRERRQDIVAPKPEHPIEIMARAFGLTEHLS